MAAIAPSTVSRPRPRPAGSAARRPDLRVVPPVRHTGRYVAILLILGALGVFGIVSLAALAAEAAFEARALEGEVRELSARYDELTAEVASLEAPERVGRIAVERLGMVPVEDPGVLMTAREIPPAGQARDSWALGSGPQHPRTAASP
jgi:cell division protein FtsL